MKHILRLCVSVPVNESISTQPCTYIKLQFSYITLKAFSDNLNVGHCETVFSPSRTLSYNFEIPTSTIQLIIFVIYRSEKRKDGFVKKSQKFLRVSSFFIRRFLQYHLSWLKSYKWSDYPPCNFEQICHDNLLIDFFQRKDYLQVIIVRRKIAIFLRRFMASEKNIFTFIFIPKSNAIVGIRKQDQV